jgi:hypothetical protein
MITPTKLLTVFILFFILQSCMENTAEEYFDRAALNSNSLMFFGGKDFKNMADNKNANQLLVFDDKKMYPAKSYEDYILRNMIPSINQTIEKIKDLKPTEETTPLINASLDLFTFAKSKYETDYIKIAKLMDLKSSQPEIDKAIADMENTSFPLFEAKYKSLWDTALPYAKKHGIEVKTF